jgi:cytokinin dehydrogenase
VTCSSTRVRGLFDACRGGLGQCAIIVDARLRLLTAPAQARVHELRYPDLATLLADQLHIAEAGTRVDYMLAGMRPGSGGGWAFSLELAKYLAPGDRCDDAALLDGLKFIPETSSARTLAYADYVRRLDYLEATAQAEANSRAAHPWMDLLLPDGAAPEVIAFALSTLDPAHFADGHVMTYVVPSGSRNTPLVDVPGQRFGFLFDVLPTVPSGAQARLEIIDRSCRRILGLARARGARVYPIGFPVGTDLMGDVDWRAQFAGQYQSFAEAKRTFDPDDILTPGPGVWGRP